MKGKGTEFQKKGFIMSAKGVAQTGRRPEVLCRLSCCRFRGFLAKKETKKTENTQAVEPEEDPRKKKKEKRLRTEGKKSKAYKKSRRKRERRGGFCSPKRKGGECATYFVAGEGEGKRERGKLGCVGAWQRKTTAREGRTSNLWKGRGQWGGNKDEIL